MTKHTGTLLEVRELAASIARDGSNDARVMVEKLATIQRLRNGGV